MNLFRNVTNKTLLQTLLLFTFFIFKENQILFPVNFSTDTNNLVFSESLWLDCDWLKPKAYKCVDPSP